MTVSANSLPNVYSAMQWGFPIGSPYPETIIDKRLKIVFLFLLIISPLKK